MSKKIRIIFIIIFCCLGKTTGCQASNALSSGSVTTPDQEQKYEHLINKYASPSKLKVYREKAQRYKQKYNDKSFIDHVTNAEKYRQQAQIDFNNQIAYEWKIPNLTPPFFLSIRNGDLAKIGCFGIEWIFEYFFYKQITHFLVNHVLSELQLHSNEVLQTLETISANLEKNNDQDLSEAMQKMHALCIDMHPHSSTDWAQQPLPLMIATNIIFEHIVHALKKYYVLDNENFPKELALLGAQLLGINQRKTFVNHINPFDLFEVNYISTMPSTIIKTSLSHFFVNTARSYGLLPTWYDYSSIVIAKRIAFSVLFMRWSMNNLFKPLWFDHVIHHRKELCDLLKKQESSPQNDQSSEDLLKNFVTEGYAPSFSLWLTAKADKYSTWNGLINIAALTPACIKTATWIYKTISTLYSQTNVPQQQEQKKS